jgi:hypothetical protein
LPFCSPPVPRHPKLAGYWPSDSCDTCVTVCRVIIMRIITEHRAFLFPVQRFNRGISVHDPRQAQQGLITTPPGAFSTSLMTARRRGD